LIRVLVIHDMEVVRAGVAALLARCDDMVVVAEVDRLEPPLDAFRCTELGADVVLTDPYRPGGGGSDAIRRLVRSCPEIRVVTIAGSRDDDAVRSAVQAGASACVRITVEQASLVRAIRGAVEGRLVLPADAMVAATLTESPPAVTPGWRYRRS
jgi:DNA-binding NarL/FixJ family response regulator